MHRRAAWTQRSTGRQRTRAAARAGGCVDPPAHGHAVCTSGTCSVVCDAPYLPVVSGGVTYCSPFGGVYVKHQMPGVCRVNNPLTMDCTCPVGFTAREVPWRFVE